MGIRLPYSRHKRYLTGSDWSIHMLDHMAKRATGTGNLSQVILRLHGGLAPGTLRRVLDLAADRHPVLCGMPTRDWNLCPYWKVPGPVPGQALSLTVAPGLEKAADRIGPELLRNVNQPLAGPREHVRFCLVPGGTTRTWLGMAFDHRLLDAAGAETFLALLDHVFEGTDAPLAAQVSLAEPAHLDDWWQRLVCGRTVNRLLVRLSRQGLRYMPCPGRCPGRPMRFEVVHCSEAETATAVELARQRAGPFLFLPYALAQTIRSLHPLFEAYGRGDGQYVVPVPVDLRRPQDRWPALFFNHLSFLFFQVPVTQVAEPQALVNTVRGQFYEQVSGQTMAALDRVSALTRIAPPWLMSQFARIPLGGRVGSFTFGCLKEPGFGRPSFLGHTVEDLFHTPRVPPPPGLGVFCQFVSGRLNLVFSYLDGLLRPDGVRDAASRLKQLLQTG